MSFDKDKDVIEAGDTVILYVSFNSMHAITVTPERLNKRSEVMENIFQTSYGALKVADLVGKKYGTKIKLSRGYAYALHPTPELWTKTLPHRTQILYATDISLIIQQLELKPGSLVIESGTGSGSLAHSLVRAIKPTGHLHTFDFHQKRVELATEEFVSHKIDKFATVRRRDVCSDGFGEDLDGKADAVFLDLPHPWDAVPFAKRAMNRNKAARLCSFSPCVEQVQKSILSMRKEGFFEITTMECILREFQVRKITVPLFDPDRQQATYSAGKKRKLDSDPSGDSDNLELKVTEETVKDEATFVTGVPLLSMPGHTGYLTFATLPSLLP